MIQDGINLNQKNQHQPQTINKFSPQNQQFKNNPSVSELKEEEVYSYSNIFDTYEEHQGFSFEPVHNEDLPREKYKPEDTPYAEVVFKCGRKKIYRNDYLIQLNHMEYVIVEVENGIDLGALNSFGPELQNRISRICKCDISDYAIIRTATPDDIEKFKRNNEEELVVVDRTREYVELYNLDMKITEAEWQFDRQRLTIYFTAPQRIDFRELVKDLARSFKTRIELRQISTREEAKRLGGVGSCGRRLCCTCFVQDFSHITLDHARLQQLSNNVAKLSGYCGRLKCCLLYEYDSYIDAFKKYPPLNSRIVLPDGEAKIVKVDIFRDIAFLHNVKLGTYRQLKFSEVDNLRSEGKILPPLEEDLPCRKKLEFAGDADDPELLEDTDFV
jgi:cell fate regulator YaaT (PSP1 superfamily)